MEKWLFCQIHELKEGKILSKLTPYGAVAVVKLGDKIIAFQDECTHDGAPFDEAEIDLTEHEITCPRHGAKFDLLTGQVKKPPATENIEIFKVEIQNEDVYIQFD
ncbi:MAG: Rieske 2Fe-2S domain-containing protein [Leptospiraceae bacterium]|nr:Rieske 2Fe-2S domain-containing protein [Leptospiraceae bacterium]MDW7976555.1 Rieske 2Fe-2S domain-containing protein [Leptospiraceae bacterium]